MLGAALSATAIGAGAWWGLAHTAAGQELVTRLARRALDGALDGYVSVEGTSGSLVSGLTARGVRVYGRDSALIADLPAVAVGYDLLDILRGRVVLRRVSLVRPVITIVQRANGRLNVEDLLRLGLPDTTTERGPRSLLAFRGATIVKGTLFLKLQAGGGSREPGAEEFEQTADGLLRVRRFTELDADLSEVRITSPEESGVRIDINTLAVQATDPAVVITRARGRVTVAGDSVVLNLQPLGLGQSLASGGGTIRFPKGSTLYNLTFDGDPVHLEDLHWLIPSLPPDAVARGKFAVLTRSSGAVVFRFNDLSVSHHDGSIDGNGAVVIPEEGGATLMGIDLTARNMDLEFVRPFLDTLPLAGRLSGRARADGPVDSLSVDVDWALRDTVAEGPSVNSIRAQGVVAVGGGGGLRFRPLYVERASLELATVRRVVPAIPLEGVWEAAGTLEGPMDATRFSGTLVHHDGSDRGPRSMVRGVIGLDARGDTLGVNADVEADSLDLETLAPSFPGFPLKGTYGGTVRLQGNLATLDVRAELAGPAGRFRSEGALTLLEPHLGGRDFQITGRDVNLARLLRMEVPESRLNFALRADGELDAEDHATGEGTLGLALSRSEFGGVSVDTAFGTVRLRGGVIEVDTLNVRMPGLRGGASGTLVRGRDGSGTLAIGAEADTLGALDPLVRRLFDAERDSIAQEDRLTGRAHARLTLTGRVDSFTLQAQVTAPAAGFEGWTVIGGELAGSVSRASAPVFSARFEADSLVWGDRAGPSGGFGAAEARVEGRADSLHWFARSRLGDIGGFLSGGRYTRTGATQRYSLDSLAVLLADGAWFLSAPVTAVDSDTGLVLSPFELAAIGGRGKVQAEGRLPRETPGDLSVRLEDFPVTGVYTLLGGDTSGVAGSLTANLRVTGTRAEPIATGALLLTDGQFGAFRAPRVDGQMDYRNRLLSGALRLTANAQPIVSVDVRLPLELALQDVRRRELPGPLEVRARADSMDLAVLDALTDLFTAVRGRLDADVAVTGSWEEPRLAGGVRIRDGAASIAGLGVRYESVNGAVRLAGDTISFDSLSVVSGQGSAQVGGVIRLERLTRPNLDLRIQARNFRALDVRGYLALTATGQLNLQGPVYGARLSGNLIASSGVLYFTDLVYKQIVNLDDPELVELIDTTFLRRARLGPEFHNRFFDSLRIRDLSLEMGSDVWMRSTEANFQLSGTLDVDKEGAIYRFDGTLAAPRGTYRLNLRILSREFVVTRGQVRFFGTPDLNPELDIDAKHVLRAIRDQREVTIYVHIGGTLLSPKLTLLSDERPPLSQTEIFSYLLFGAPRIELAGQGQTGQGQYVNQVMASLSGVLSSEVERALISDLGLPLDYVEIRPGVGSDPLSSLSGSQVAVGVQIGRKTFLTLNAGFCPNQRVRLGNTLGASVQFRVSQEWRTELGFEPVRQCTDGTPVGGATTAAPYQVGFDLLWERRY
jgi:translocation and assembly module TamB